MSTKTQPQETETKSNHEQIALQAYGLWQKDGCKPGHDLDYWLAAEKQLQNSSRFCFQRPITQDPVQTPIQGSRTAKTNHLRRAGNGQIATAGARS